METFRRLLFKHASILSSSLSFDPLRGGDQEDPNRFVLIKACTWNASLSLMLPLSIINVEQIVLHKVAKFFTEWNAEWLSSSVFRLDMGEFVSKALAN